MCSRKKTTIIIKILCIANSNYHRQVRVCVCALQSSNSQSTLPLLSSLVLSYSPPCLSYTFFLSFFPPFLFPSLSSSLSFFLPFFYLSIRSLLSDKRTPPILLYLISLFLSFFLYLFLSFFLFSYYEVMISYGFIYWPKITDFKWND